MHIDSENFFISFKIFLMAKLCRVGDTEK
jgi:hypothetical protein